MNSHDTNDWECDIYKNTHGYVKVIMHIVFQIFQMICLYPN